MTQSSAMGDDVVMDGDRAASGQPIFEPRPSRRLFATAASEPRARRLTDLLLLLGSVVGLMIASAAEFPSPGFLVALTAFVRSAPSFLDTAWQISADVLALFALVLLIATFVRRRFDVARDLVVALIVSTVVWLLVGRWAQGDWPAFTRALRSANPHLWYPSPRLALPAAVIVTSAPHLTRPIRRVGRWLIVLACVGIVALGASSPLGAVAGVLVGATAGCVVHLIFGSSAGRPSLSDVERALSKVGVHARSLAPAARQRAGVFEVMGEDTAGRQLVIKVYGRDAHDSALATTMWRTLWYRDPGSPLRFGRLQQVEHEAFVTLLAAQFGVLTEQVVTAGATVDDDAILVLRGRGSLLSATTLDEPAAARAVDQLWKVLAELHRGGIAHGQVDSDTIIVDGGQLGLADFGGASVGATDGRIGADRAQALVTTVLLVGAAPAIAAARRAIGVEGLAAMLPYLQGATLTRSQRRDVKEADLDVDDLRALAAEAAGAEAPELQQLRRITWGTVLRVVLPALAVVALTSAISGMELDGVWDEVVAATWWLLLLGFVIAQLVRLSQSISTLGASPKPLPFGPVYGLQLSVAYVTIAIPSYAARVAMSVRFFQRQGVPAGAALAAGALDTMTTFFIEIIGITALLMFTPASLDFDFSGTGQMATRLLTIVGVLLAAIVLAVILFAKLRRFVVEWAKRLGTESMAVMRGLRSPRRLALLVGGNIGSEILFTLALGTFAFAMGTSVSFADLLLIHLSVSLLAGIVPVPGGIGVAEAMLTMGLIRAGMPDEAAFAAVICYRASTFYLPPIWGYFSMRWLERSRYI
jgi:uncharacterized membrane protein YbhN (UPF0104 family)